MKDRLSSGQAALFLPTLKGTPVRSFSGFPLDIRFMAVQMYSEQEPYPGSLFFEGL